MADSPIPAALSRQVGGLPVYGWAAIVGGGLLLGRRLAAGRGGGSGGGTPTPFVDPNPTGYIATGEPGTTTGPTGSGPVKPTTNAEWRRAAVDYLVSNGTAPVIAERAIGRYLSGAALDAQDAAAVNTAVRYLGSPPEAPPTPDTPVKTPGVPRAVKSTTVRRKANGVGESANDVATRVRKATPLTTDGRPLTGAYIASLNGLRSTTAALWEGTRLLY